MQSRNYSSDRIARTKFRKAVRHSTSIRSLGVLCVFATLCIAHPTTRSGTCAMKSAGNWSMWATESNFGVLAESNAARVIVTRAWNPYFVRVPSRVREAASAQYTVAQLSTAFYSSKLVWTQSAVAVRRTSSSAAAISHFRPHVIERPLPLWLPTPKYTSKLVALSSVSHIPQFAHWKVRVRFSEHRLVYARAVTKD